MNYGNGNYTITARSGREYLVTYSGYDLNSSVYAPEFWSLPFRSLGLSWYPGSGHGLGGGSARWVDFKARRVIDPDMARKARDDDEDYYRERAARIDERNTGGDIVSGTSRDEIVEQTKWPERVEDATADALIRHGARIAVAVQAHADDLMDEAFAIDRESPEYKPAMRRYLDAISAFIAEAQAVVALAEAQKRSPEAGDELARLMWELTEDGGVLHELMYDYLAGRGVDADAVFKFARASDGSDESL